MLKRLYICYCLTCMTVPLTLLYTSINLLKHALRIIYNWFQVSPCAFMVLETLVWLCIKTGIQKRGTECGKCFQIFQRMSSNILKNVAKHSGECRQTFWGMSPNITVPDVSWSSHQKCSMKTWCSFNFTKLTKENTCAWVFFKIKLQASGNYTKKTFFTEQLWRLLPCMT